MLNYVYADNAATTALSKNAYEAMKPFLEMKYGNPSGIYRMGREAKRSITSARDSIAHSLGAESKEIYFTGSGSEANNWAIKGSAERKKKHGKHMITTMVEHHSVLNTMKYMEKQGFAITYLPVDSFGMISLDQLTEAIREDTILISIMAANNEVGTVFPIKEIGAIAKEHSILFHVDGVQAVGHLPLDIEDSNIDLLSFSAHKFHGPKGVGALYIKKGVQLEPLIHGGGQEKAIRAGTENVAGIVGMAKALEETLFQVDEKREKLKRLTASLTAGILQLPKVRLTGDPNNRLPSIASFVFDGLDGKELIHALDTKGITCSSGSACDSGSLDPSHVLLAMGISHKEAQGALRISLSEESTAEEIDYILQSLEEICKGEGI